MSGAIIPVLIIMWMACGQAGYWVLVVNDCKTVRSARIWAVICTLIGPIVWIIFLGLLAISAILNWDAGRDQGEINDG